MLAASEDGPPERSISSSVEAARSTGATAMCVSSALSALASASAPSVFFFAFLATSSLFLMISSSRFSFFCSRESAPLSSSAAAASPLPRGTADCPSRTADEEGRSSVFARLGAGWSRPSREPDGVEPKGGDESSSLLTFFFFTTSPTCAALPSFAPSFTGGLASLALSSGAAVGGFLAFRASRPGLPRMAFLPLVLSLRLRALLRAESLATWMGWSGMQISQLWTTRVSAVSSRLEPPT